MKTQRCSYVLAALVAAGVFTFLCSMAKRARAPFSFLYSRPEGGEREGEFELFIGS